MTEEDAILNAAAVYTEEEVLARFQQSCEAEAEEPGQHTGSVWRATDDLIQMLNRQNRAVQAKKK